jgi:hypothetical protein
LIWINPARRSQDSIARRSGIKNTFRIFAYRSRGKRQRFVITAYLKSTVPYDDAVPGASIAVQTYGDFLNFNPHLHAIVSDGSFLEDGRFQTASVFMLEDVDRLFVWALIF